MKISVLIAQYFYQNKVLNLPGIGSFYLDESIDAQSIGNKSDLLEHIHFAQKAIARPDDSLIEFIRKHTGKIKPLAESDLETFVADGKLMLNIGKPFHIDGVGTLQKNREGIYEFTPGAPVVQRLEPLPALPVQDWDQEKQVKKKSVFEENPYESQNASTKKIAIGAGIVLGLVVIIWGGYSVYSKKANNNDNPSTAANTTASTAQTNTGDTTQRVSAYVHNIDSPAEALEQAIKKDTVILNDAVSPTASATGATPNTTTPATSPAAGPSHNYKFVLETFTRKTSAMRRYNMLKPRVALESVDTTLFKIVISLPGTAADTTRLKDSLHYWYWGPRTDRKVTIEP